MLKHEVNQIKSWKYQDQNMKMNITYHKAPRLKHDQNKTEMKKITQKVAKCAK